MIKITRIYLQLLAGILFVAGLTACGSSSSTPVATTIPLSVTTYYAHNLLFKNNTTLSTGYNAFGQLGNGFLLTRFVPDTLVRHYPFAGLATGGVHSVAFINNSTVRSWGYNGYGQLGNNTTTYSSVPVKTVDISGVKAVAAGVFHSLALKNDGTVWSWGLNDAGQLGVVKTTLAFGYSPVPKMVGGTGLANVSAIAANAKHSLALADGKVWAWGFNGSGQVGIDSNVSGEVSTPVIVAGLPASGIAAIAAGGAFSYAVANDGTLWAWGCNGNGQLGNNSVVSSYQPVQVRTLSGAPLTGVVGVAAGIQHGLALLGDGTVWAWGYNHFGQLGNSSLPDSLSAVRVPLLSGVTEVRAFGSSSMARTGAVWYGWGDNTFGQLGVSMLGSVLAPLKVLGF